MKKGVDFSRDIRPLLAKHCYACHGPDKSEGGVKLTDFAAATSIAESGAKALVPHKPEESAIVARVASINEAERMPPEGKPLTAREIELLRQWISEGGEFKQHWAFLPLKRPAVPKVEHTDWVRTPIDAFIMKDLEQSELLPVEPAAARELVRRLYFNILGLPPTVEEVESFVRDPSEQAYETLVDRLLAHPAFGERWGRHWLDLVRYAETNSYERDGTKPNAWKYRDYVIRSLNADKPYSQFLSEQIAGDELENVTRETLTATGFYRLGIWDDEPVDSEQARFDEYDDIVSTTGQAFLGLTLNCARCHDHKIDPILQKDYYQMVAFFRDVSSYGTRKDEQTNSQIDMTPRSLNDESSSLNKELQKLEKEMREIEERGIVKMSAEDQRATEGGGRGKVIREKLKEHLDQADWAAWTQRRDRVKDLRDEIKKLPLRDSILGLAVCDPRPPTTHLLARGNPAAPGAEVQPDFPKLFGSASPIIPLATQDAKSAGRRKALASWLVADDNRLTARVIVNRLWQHHLGRGLHKSPNNFGQMGEPPTHPELLDWLATELIRNNWNMKSIHRIMLLSSTYRMSSHATSDKALAIDPSNNLFWRFNMRRLSAEEIRDRVLATTGRLNSSMFGPSIYPKLADDVKASQSVPGKGWQDSSESELSKRSIYIHIKRSLIPPELSNFDFPETDSSCEARFLTTQPGQALGMLNGAFMQDQAKAWSERLRSSSPRSNQELWGRAIEVAWGRPASDQDIGFAKQLTEKLKASHKLTEEQAMDYFCLVLMNANEFLYLD